MDINTNASRRECPLCGTYLPSLGHLISELDAAENRFADGVTDSRDEINAIARSLNVAYPNYAEVR